MPDDTTKKTPRRTSEQARCTKCIIERDPPMVCPNGGWGIIGGHNYNIHVTAITYKCICGSWMGWDKSRGSEPGVDPFGACPKNASSMVADVIAEASPAPRVGAINVLSLDGVAAFADADATVMIKMPEGGWATLESASLWIKTKTRPSWGEHHMMEAYVAALRGSCLRKRVGAVIIDPNNRLVSGGFNGAPSKQPSCLDVGCDLQPINGRESCVRTLHAESNALDYAGRQARGCALFTTVIPCRPCAMRIIQAGIDSVYYSEYYESQGTKATKALLEGAGVKLMHLTLPVNELTVALRRAVGEIP